MKKEELGQVFTKNNIAAFMVSLFSLQKSESILDPCFGSGVFVDELIKAGYNKVTGCEIDQYWFNYVTAQGYSDVVLNNCDFLKYLPKDTYDGIIMNPPYVRQEKIDSLEKYGISKKILADNPCFKVLPRTANLYMYFIFKGIDLLRNNGEMVVIFPSSWLDARNGIQLKNYLFTECDVVEQLHIHGDVFTDEAMVDVVILKIIKRKPKSYSQPLPRFINVIGEEVQNINPINNTVIDLGLEKSLLTYATVRRGLSTGYNEMFVNPQHSFNINNLCRSLISSPKDVIGFSTENARLDYLLAVNATTAKVKELKDYVSFFEEKIVQEQKPKTLYEKIKSNRNNWYYLNTFDGKGLIFSYFVRNDMKFVLNDLDVVVRDNFYVIKPNIDKYLMFALLNNYYTYYQLELCGKKYGAGLLKLQRYDIENLKLPKIETISNDDIASMIHLAMQVIHDNNSKLILDITMILSRYTKVSYEDISNQYSEIKKNRLENV